MFQKLYNDEAGVIISAELVLIMTITVLAMVVGLQSLSKTINHELNDVSQAFSVIDQSFSYEGIRNPTHAKVAGSGFEDRRDDCDCSELVEVAPTTKEDPGDGQCKDEGNQNTP